LITKDVPVSAQELSTGRFDTHSHVGVMESPWPQTLFPASYPLACIVAAAHAPQGECPGHRCSTTRPRQTHSGCIPRHRPIRGEVADSRRTSGGCKRCPKSLPHGRWARGLRFKSACVRAAEHHVVTCFHAPHGCPVVPPRHVAELHRVVRGSADHEPAVGAVGRHAAPDA
jgi:hypothetical protein